MAYGSPLYLLSMQKRKAAVNAKQKQRKVAKKTSSLARRFEVIASTRNKTSHIICYSKNSDTWSLRFQYQNKTITAPTIEEVLSQAAQWIEQNITRETLI